MSSHSLRSVPGFTIPLLLSALLFAGLLAAPRAAAQTTQPYLFAATNNSSGELSGFVTVLRDSTTGVLTLVPNTSVSFKDPCSPTIIDPTGNFLFGMCGEGVTMYTLDATTGVVSETPSSPYTASASTGQNGVLLASESTGQYVYLLKVGNVDPPNPSAFTLDTFQIDASTPALVPANSQSLSFTGTWVGSAADPARHGMFIFVNQSQGGSFPEAVLYFISFDPSTGLADVSANGINIGSNALSIAASPAGVYLALGWGDTVGNFTVYQVSTTDFSLAAVGSVALGAQDTNYGTYTFPASIYFSPGGNLLYVQAPPQDFAGGSLPFLVYNPQSLALVPTTPIPVASATFLNGVADPQAPFTYVGNSPPTNGISVYQVDLSTGLASQPAPISSPFFQPTNISPLFVTVEQSGQGIQAPTLGTSPAALTFTSTTTGQSSSPQNIVLKSLGAQSVTLSSIEISGANASDFTETDNCLSSPVLPNNHSCTIAVTYSPSAVGSSQAVLFVADNAAGSPQGISLFGTAVAPPPGAPAATLNPASALTFPGTPTQGTSTSPQNISVTNSGSASLQILSAVLSGFNASDFSISSDTCSGALAVNSSCNIAVVFSPTASGIRSTTLTLTDNAANSPQSLSISGTAAPAATVATPTGSSTTVSVTAGQTAQFNLQVTPGAGFSGTLAFSCTGAPFGATCTVPATLPVTNGNAVSFTVSISTLAASQLIPTPAVPPSSARPGPTLYILGFLAALGALFPAILSRRQSPSFAHALSAATATVLSLLLVFSGIGCSGGGSSAAQSAPTVPTVTTPTIQPSGGTFTASQSVSITDGTAGATIYYTTDGSTPSTSSPLYSAPFSLTSATNVQAMAAANGYNNSSSTSASFKFRTPAASYPITINVTATASNSTKLLQLNPIALTLIVN